MSDKTEQPDDMKCLHPNTSCIDSRPYGYKGCKPKTSFAYITYRRLKCIDCDYRFTTYEVTAQQIKKVLGQGEKAIAALNRIKDAINETKD